MCGLCGLRCVLVSISSFHSFLCVCVYVCMWLYVFVCVCVVLGGLGVFSSFLKGCIDLFTVVVLRSLLLFGRC